jgi:hypothetical protein
VFISSPKLLPSSQEANPERNPTVQRSAEVTGRICKGCCDEVSGKEGLSMFWLLITAYLAREKNLQRLASRSLE